MIWQQIFLGIVGVSGGIMVSSGVFTVLLAVGLVPRFAGKTHTGKHVFLYEEMVVLGTLTGVFFSVFEERGHVGQWIVSNMVFGTQTVRVWQILSDVLMVFFGGYAGIFVGCLALAIAEMLNTIPIFARRIGFRHGLGIAILSMALGKVVGSLIYFMQGVYRYGGR